MKASRARIMLTTALAPLFLIGCTSTISGTYSHITDPGYISTTLQILPDSTFRYCSYFHLAQDTASGTLTHLVGNQYIARTFKQSFPLREYHIGSDSLIVLALQRDSHSTPTIVQITAIYSDSTRVSSWTNSEGVARFSKKSSSHLDSLRYQFFGATESFTVKSMLADSLILFVDEDYHDFIINDDIWRITRRGVYFPKSRVPLKKRR